MADQGPFLSLLDWLESAGEVPLNVIAGRPGAAGRKAVDFLGQIPDAILPGNLIPDAATEEDDISASEAFGIDRRENPLGAKLTDIVGGTALNPLTWLGVRGGGVRAGVPFTQGTAIPAADRAVSRARELAGAGWERLPESIREPLGATAKATGQGIRRTLNWLDVPEEGQALMAKASGAGTIAAKAADARLRQIYEGMTPAEIEAVGEIAHGIARGGSEDRNLWSVIRDRQAYAGGRTDIRPDVVLRAADERQKLMDIMATEGADAGIFSRDIGQRPGGYIRREFSGDYFKDVEDPSFRRGPSGAMKARQESLQTPDDLLRFLREEQSADLDFNAMAVDARRAGIQGRLTEKAAAGRALTGLDDFALANPEHRAAVDDAIKQLRASGQDDYAYKLENLWRGTAPRSKNAFAQALHQGNKLFKGAATFGILLPRIGFSVRNRIGGLWQALSDDVARGQSLGPSTKRAFSDLMGAVDDGFVALTNGKRGRLTGSDLTKSLDYIDNAFKQSGGSTAQFRQLLASHPDKKMGEMLMEAMDNRVLDDFVSSEQLIGEMARTPARQRTMDILMWPAAIARGVEQRMRLGTFMDLRRAGIKPEAAAKTVKDTYLDYSTPGWENRAFRDIIPFGAFLSQNVKQQSKFIASQPAVGVVAAQFFGEDEGLPKYPWLEGQMAIPTGLDEQGNPQYMTYFGLPIEGLTAVPGLGADDAYRDIVGSMQPLLKTGIAYMVDKDPFTGREFGEYDKILGNQAGELGRAYNVAMGTGLPQAVATPLNQIANLMDERKSIAERAMQFGTGARFVSVDPDLAQRQQLEDYLESRPDIRKAPNYYQTGEDQELADVLKELREAKERLKAKRAAQTAL